MSAMERTKSESEVSMKDVDDEVDDYEEVKPTRSRWENAINHASSRRRRMSLRLNIPKMRWKLTRMKSPKERSVCALFMATWSETNKHVQGDNLTHLLLADPVSGNLIQPAQPRVNCY